MNKTISTAQFAIGVRKLEKQIYGDANHSLAIKCFKCKKIIGFFSGYGAIEKSYCPDCWNLKKLKE